VGVLNGLSPARLLQPPFGIISRKGVDMPHNPKTYDGAARPDEAPATFAEIKPLGYWPTRVA
jgi:hypothetical protein